MLSCISLSSLTNTEINSFTTIRLIILTFNLITYYCYHYDTPTYFFAVRGISMGMNMGKCGITQKWNDH